MGVSFAYSWKHMDGPGPYHPLGKFRHSKGADKEQR